MEKINIPPVILEMIGNMADVKQRPGIRENYHQTLMNIRDAIDTALKIYERKK